MSRSSVPALALLRDGRAAARRAGGGPAAAIDAARERLRREAEARGGETGSAAD